jgi:hypothetical protein
MTIMRGLDGTSGATAAAVIPARRAVAMDLPGAMTSANRGVTLYPLGVQGIGKRMNLSL